MLCAKQQQCLYAVCCPYTAPVLRQVNAISIHLWNEEDRPSMEAPWVRVRGQVQHGVHGTPCTCVTIPSASQREIPYALPRCCDPVP